MMLNTFTNSISRYYIMHLRGARLSACTVSPPHCTCVYKPQWSTVFDWSRMNTDSSINYNHDNVPVVFAWSVNDIVHKVLYSFDKSSLTECIGRYINKHKWGMRAQSGTGLNKIGDVCEFCGVLIRTQLLISIFRWFICVYIQAYAIYICIY